MLNWVLSVITSFGIDFGVTTNVGVSFLPPSKFDIVEDKYRGKRYADGYCELSSDPWSPSVIKLNRDVWALLNDWQRRELVYHELGHCVLLLNHTIGRSIMNPIAPNAFWVYPDGSNWNSMVRRMRTDYNYRLENR